MVEVCVNHVRMYEILGYKYYYYVDILEIV